MTTTLVSRHWPAYGYWWVWIDVPGGLMYKCVMDDFGELVRVSEVV